MVLLFDRNSLSSSMDLLTLLTLPASAHAMQGYLFGLRNLISILESIVV
jgi:hypothetical protein